MNNNFNQNTNNNNLNPIPSQAFYHFPQRYTPETNVYLNNTVYYLTIIENTVNFITRIQEHRKRCPRCIIHTIKYLATRPLHTD